MQTCGHVSCLQQWQRPCHSCKRRTHYGVLVDTIRRAWRPTDPEFLLALEALAFIWSDRGTVARDFQEALREEALAGQRDARDAYSEGLQDGRRQSGEEW